MHKQKQIKNTSTNDTDTEANPPSKYLCKSCPSVQVMVARYSQRSAAHRNVNANAVPCT